ncbi:hypothetical protein BC830DRAFT_824874 [Chytriomyces sp. MP71]|nr:hypothetical protein BC830DRAFT_824874 [Chytriomyces sp. MP71]
MVAYCVDNDGIQLRLADSSPSATSNAISSSGSNSSVPFVSTASNPSETRGVTTSAVTSTAQTVISVILTSATMTFVPTTSASSQPSVPPSPSSPATPPPSSTVIMTNSFSSTQSALPAPSGPNAAAIAGSLIAVLLLVSFCFGVSHFVFQRRNKKSDELLIGPHTAYLQMDDEHDVYDIPLYYAQAAVVHGIARTDTTGSSTSLAMPRRGDTVFSAETLSRGMYGSHSVFAPALTARFPLHRTESSVHSKTDQTTVADNPFADTPPPAPVMKSFRVAIAPTDPPSVVHVSPSEESQGARRCSFAT